MGPMAPRNTQTRAFLVTNHIPISGPNGRSSIALRIPLKMLRMPKPDFHRQNSFINYHLLNPHRSSSRCEIWANSHSISLQLPDSFMRLIVSHFMYKTVRVGKLTV